jgi:hypothetical protein
MRSACAIAASVSGSGFGLRGCAAADARLSGYGAAVGESGFENHVSGGGRIDPAEDGQHFGRHFNGTAEIAGEVRQDGKKQIPEAMAFEAAAG